MGVNGRKQTSFRIALGVLVLMSLGSFAFAQEKQDFVSAFLDLHPSNELSNTGLTVFPILYFPVGGEQQAMGMAYTAVARDVSYMEANPAGSPLLANSEVSVYH